MAIKKYRKWEYLSSYFNESFRFTGDRAKDRTRLAGKIGNLRKELKTEKNPIKQKVILDVIYILESMMK